MKIEGLFETHIRVADLERSMQFYGATLGLEWALTDYDRRIAFYWIGEHNRFMLGLWQHPTDEIFRQHFAFQIPLESMRKAASWLQQRGLDPHNFLKLGTRQPMVFAWMPAVAIYFTDPDRHSLEFITPLPHQAKPELGIVAWDEWEAQHAAEVKDFSV